MAQSILNFLVKAGSVELVEGGLEVLRAHYGSQNTSVSRIQSNPYGEPGFHAYFNVHEEPRQ